jgi:hypothetical protein
LAIVLQIAKPARLVPSSTCTKTRSSPGEIVAVQFDLGDVPVAVPVDTLRKQPKAVR